MSTTVAKAPMGEDKKGNGSANGSKSGGYEKPKKNFLQSILNFSRGVSNQFISDGYALLKQGNHKHAIAAFRSALSEDPESYEAYMGLGKTFADMGHIKNTKQAIDAYHKASTIDIYRTEAYQACVSLYNRLGDQKNAAAERRKLHTIKTLKATPDNAIANNNLGIIQLTQKQYDAAIKSFTKAAKADRKNPTPQFNLAKAWFQKATKEEDAAKKKQILKKAAQELELYLRLNITAEGLLLKAKIFLLYGDLNNALTYCNQAYQLEPSLKEVYATKRVIEEKLGNIGEASRAYENYQSLSKEEKQMQQDDAQAAPSEEE